MKICQYCFAEIKNKKAHEVCEWNCMPMSIIITQYDWLEMPPELGSVKYPYLVSMKAEPAKQWLAN